VEKLPRMRTAYDQDVEITVKSIGSAAKLITFMSA